MNNTWQYLWVANGSVHESSCSWTNKNIGNLKMMVENRTCLVASRRNKRNRVGLFWMVLFFRESDRYTSQIDVSFFFKKIAIQNIHPILNANILKCFNFKTLKHLNIKMLKLRSWILYMKSCICCFMIFIYM